MSSRTRPGANSAFTIQDIFLASGPAEGISFDGNTVRIAEYLCAGLARGESKSILVTYSVVGRFGEEMPKTAIFHLSKSKNGPVISSHMFPKSVLKNGKICFDLLSAHAA